MIAFCASLIVLNATSLDALHVARIPLGQVGIIASHAAPIACPAIRSHVIFVQYLPHILSMDSNASPVVKIALHATHQFA